MLKGDMQFFTFASIHLIKQQFHIKLKELTKKILKAAQCTLKVTFSKTESPQTYEIFILNIF
jgi:hypothetical protein